MSSLPSIQDILNGDVRSQRQAAAFPFGLHSFLLPPPNPISLVRSPYVSFPQQLFTQQTCMDDTFFPAMSCPRSRTINHNGQEWTNENSITSATTDRTILRKEQPHIPEVTQSNMRPLCSETYRLTGGDIAFQPTEPRMYLLQEQQKQLRERMEYLSSLLESSERSGNKRSLDISVSNFEGSLSTVDSLDRSHHPPSKKRQRPDLSSNPTDDERFRAYQAEQWNEKFNDLVRFKNKHGNCCVPHTYPDDPTLARWVKRQRYQYKLLTEGKPGSTMTEERKKLLEDIGMVWDRHSEAWELRYTELCKFLNEHRHTNVPSNHPNSQLATWVKCQRRQYKTRWDADDSVARKTLLSDERINRLEKIGLEWELRSRSQRK